VATFLGVQKPAGVKVIEEGGGGWGGGGGMSALERDAMPVKTKKMLRGNKEPVEKRTREREGGKENVCYLGGKPARDTEVGNLVQIPRRVGGGGGKKRVGERKPFSWPPKLHKWRSPRTDL